MERHKSFAGFKHYISSGLLEGGGRYHSLLFPLLYQISLCWACSEMWIVIFHKSTTMWPNTILILWQWIRGWGVQNIDKVSGNAVGQQTPQKWWRNIWMIPYIFAYWECKFVHRSISCIFYIKGMKFHRYSINNLN